MSASKVSDYYNMFSETLLEEQARASWLSASGTTMFTPSPSSNSSCLTYSPSYSEQGYVSDVGDGAPYLEVVEQPVQSFRFRYRSEMQGAHGSLLARGEQNSKRRTYPTVQLHNFHGDAIVRCSLYSDGTNPVPHMHQLISKRNNKDIYDHESPAFRQNNYMVEFKGLGIVHVSKKHLKDELVRKLELKLFERLRSDKSLNERSDAEIRSAVAVRRKQVEADAEKDIKSIDPNRVKLCFEAFVRVDNRVQYICERVFSETIQNMKNVETGELKICRMDKFMGSCRGGDEVFILVEKVCKKNIQVRFYEEDESGQEVWSALAGFNDFDVHHQYAIVFRTPPYRKEDIQENVQVKIQLFRPKSNQYSDPLKFVYKPIRQHEKKRRYNSDCFSSSEAHIPVEGSPVNKDAMVGDRDPMLSGDFSSIGSYPSDALESAIEKFRQGSSGTESYDDFMKFTTTPEFTEYLSTVLQPIGGKLRSQESSDNISDMFSDHVRQNVVSADGSTSKLKCVRPAMSTAVDGAQHRVCNQRSPKSKPKDNSDLGKKTSSRSATDHNAVCHNVNYDKNKTLHLATKSYDALQEIMKSKDPSRYLEIRKVIRPKDSEVGPLHAAVIHGQLKELGNLLSLLIKGNLCKLINSVNFRKETPLITAVKRNRVDCLKVLLIAGADPNLSDIDQNSALHWAVISKAPDCLAELLSHEPCDLDSKRIEIDKRNKNGETPLNIALLSDDGSAETTNMVRLLLDAGANINLKLAGDSSLMLAVQQNDSKSTRLLLEAGADPNTTNEREDTAMHIAVSLKHHKCLKELLSFKPIAAHMGPMIDLNKKNEEGETPLHVAIRKEDVTAVKLLLEAGCDVNMKIPTSGSTPLHLAVQSKSLDIVEVLLNSKTINVMEKNHSGQTVSDYSKGNDFVSKGLAELLRKMVGLDCKEELFSDSESQDESLQIDDEDYVGDEENSTTKLSMKSRKFRVGSTVPKSKESYGKRSISEQRTLFDVDTLNIITRCLDENRKWTLLCEKFHCSFLQTCIAKFQTETTLEQFRNELLDLNVPEAVNAINSMIRKQDLKIDKRSKWRPAD